jgi:hypothetical protein
MPRANRYFFARSRVANHTSLPQEGVFAQVCKGPKALVQMAVRSKKTLRIMRTELRGDIESISG